LQTIFRLLKAIQRAWQDNANVPHSGNSRFPFCLPQGIEYTCDLVDQLMTPMEKAKRAGTLNAIDRSKQYDEADPRILLRAVNESWSKIRNLENANTHKDSEIAQLRAKLRRVQYVNVAMTSIITALAMKGLEVIFQALR
jgi:hypothetical protein